MYVLVKVPVDSIVDKYISNVGCHAGTVITTIGYSSSTACSPPHVGLVNNSVNGMSVNTTVEGVTTPIPHASQCNSSIVANADSNMSVAGGLAASSLPIIYPLQNNVYSPVPMLNQLPPITRYSGKEQPDGETFRDWLEQFESVAQLGGWNHHAKLVNLSTRLRGSAYSFYRSCTTEQ